MPRFYPILVALEGRRVVVIGGGSVAARKVPPLLECGAQVAVVSPEVSSEIEALSPPVTIVRRAYADGDLAGAFLAVSATSDSSVNAAVARDAARRGLLANVVDAPEDSTFLVPSVLRRGEVVVAVSTQGSSPALAARVRRDLEAAVGEEYGRLARLLGGLRAEVLRRVPDGPRRARLFRALVDSEALARLRRGDGDEAVSDYLRGIAFEEGTHGR